MGATSKKQGCAFCGALKSTDGGPLSQCKQCNMTAYCGEEHQNFDWKRHKPLCKTVQSQLARTTAVTAAQQRTGGKSSSSISPTSIAAIKRLAREAEPGAIQLLLSLSNEPLSVNVAPKYKKNSSGERLCERLTNTSDPDIQIFESIVGASERVSRKRVLKMNCPPPSLIDHSTNPIFTTTLEDHLKAFAGSGLVINQHQAIALRLKYIAEHTIKSLNEYGWAVVDNFLGENHCYHIHREMNYLYNNGIFSPGELMETKAGSSSQDIRSDEIYWFDSKDEQVSAAVTVRLLVSMIDSIIVHFNGRVPYKINGRSRAMLAIYPSNGTHYVKHIDNPMKDGRCITTIYYCNQNWNAQKDGGCFRLFPETSDAPLDIEPRADRLLFLWSDRRNPHEVRPVYRDRYAITIWYFDTNEKMAAMARKREQNAMEETAKNKQRLKTVLFDDEQTLPQLQPSHLKSYTKLEPDELSSHDNLSNQSNIFHPTVPTIQQPLPPTFDAEQVLERGNESW